VNILPGFLSRRIQAGFNIALRLGTDIEYVDSSKVLAIRTKAGKCFAVLSDREVQTLRSFSKLQAIFLKQAGWATIGRGYIVNINRLRRSEKPKSGGGWLLTFDNGKQLTLLAGYEKPVLEYLDVDDLLYVKPLSIPHYYLMKMGVKDLDKDITTMTKEELLANFSTASGSSVVVSVLMVNFLWQLVTYIRAGQPSPVEGGNVRSLWYQVKPVLSLLGILEDTDHYKTLSEQLSEMVQAKICSYHEFGLIEEGKWNIGTYNPHVIIMAEKEAHYRMFLQSAQDLTGATIIATGGQPSTITSEYFTDALKAKLAASPDLPPPAVLALVDYDPFGWALLDTFLSDLKTFGIRDARIVNLSLPKNYKPEDLELRHYDLEKSGDTPVAMLRRWMKLTNGINGKPWGMEADVFMRDRVWLRDLLLREGKPFFVVPPQVPKAFWQETAEFQAELRQEADEELNRVKQRSKPRRKT